jgi:anaerobic magnesium-protoporphyrin IX monomethyl ester cyclase
MKILFVYPEHYLSVGIPGGIAILSALLKREGHQVELFDTCFLKPPEYKSPPKSTDDNLDANLGDESEALHRKLHGGGGTSDRGGLSFLKPTEYTLDDLVRDDPVISSYNDEFQNHIDRFNPDIIALSCMTSTFDFACSLFENVSHKAVVVVGGVHATIAPNDCLSQDCIDYAFIGEGDLSFLDFVNKIEEKKSVSDVDGLVYQSEDGSVTSNPVGERPDLNKLPCPDWGLFDERHLFRPFEGKVYKGSFYSQSRGCPMQCTYCVDPIESALTGGSRGYFRVQDVAITVSHLTELKSKYGATWFKFSDDTFLLPKKDHLLALSDGLKPLDIQFACSVMTNTINEEKIKIVKDFGCVAMSVGVESGSKVIRKTLKRNYSDDALVKNLSLIKKHGLKLSTFNIIGSPNETREQVFETIELNRRLRTDSVNVYIMFPYPGTPIQIGSKLPIRGDDGKLIQVEEAKNLNLSKMGPDELQGLLDTFSIYLNLPKLLWPLVRLAESQSQAGKKILALLTDYSARIVTGSDLFLTDLNEDEKIMLQLSNFTGSISSCIKDLLKVEADSKSHDIVIQTLRSYCLEQQLEGSSTASLRTQSAVDSTTFGSNTA